MSSKFAAALALCLTVSTALAAAEYREGRVRLVIHEDSGRFALYYLADVSEMRYEPLFTASDPRTSFLELNVNDRIFRLGEAVSFRVTSAEQSPAVVFESPFLAMREEFRFVKTNGAAEANGVEITFRIENRDSRRVSAGLRFLLDTSLGEGQGKTPFVIGGENTGAETLITGDSGKRWWFSGNGRYSLAGSISFNTGAPSPSFLHFANWKLLNDVSWKAPYSRGRSFNYPPQSIGDSAVCYYYEPASLESGASLCYAITLAAADNDALAGFAGEGENTGELRSLLERLDRYIAGETLDSEELAVIEQNAAELKARSLR